MNYIDRIQKSIEFIEDNIDEYIDIIDAADTARMCEVEYCRFFHALTGFYVQDYIGKRRISLAISDMKTGEFEVGKLSKKYLFSSPESFSMLFRSNTGYLPTEFSSKLHDYVFEKLDVRDVFYDYQSESIKKKYPDIRLLKPIPKMRMASYTCYGQEPENRACEVMLKYAIAHNYMCKFGSFRIFGFNVPDSIKSDGTYGYTICMTVNDNHLFDGGLVKELVFENVRYAVATSTVSTMMDTWIRFKEWARQSGLSTNNHQYLEEHILCTKWREKEPINDIEINLYMPVK